ncbi:MAG TPA: hypothetical protein DCE44_04715 [Verrucomicrobiales bacterium]|nr:hypothetical protein [Verrucomicrobiales bacterium]
MVSFRPRVEIDSRPSPERLSPNSAVGSRLWRRGLGSIRLWRVVLGIPPNTSFNQLIPERNEGWCVEASGATPESARGTRALSNSISEFGLSRARPPLPTTIHGVVALVGLCFWIATAFAESGDAALERWLMAQAQLKSWSAEFVQTRHLQTLTRPLTASGRVWFAAPDQFRWELGSPPQSVAMRSGDELWMLSPPLKRAERYILAAARRGPMKDSLALLDTGFPRDPTDFRKRFELLTFSNTNAVYEFRLRPRDLGTRRVLPELTLVVTTNLLELAASDLTFADGSRLRNDFTNALRNPTVEPAVFAPALDATWKITNPGTGQ